MVALDPRVPQITSPIRRYSDLILHRLLKTIIRKDDKAKAHILKDIEAVVMTVSRLERKPQKSSGILSTANLLGGRSKISANLLGR